MSAPCRDLTRRRCVLDDYTQEGTTFPVSAVVERTEYEDIYELRAERCVSAPTESTTPSGLRFGALAGCRGDDGWSLVN